MSRLRTRVSPAFVVIACVAAGLAAPASAYTVRAGDTVSGIAASHHRSIRCIVRASHLADANLIRVGQHLVVKNCRQHEISHHHTWHHRIRATARHGGGLRAYARRLAGGEYYALASIIVRESGWNVHATNPSSGAYGIPQALPGSKMASAGPNWRNNGFTQLRWMVSYCRSTYGSISSAWAFWQGHGWY